MDKMEILSRLISLKNNALQRASEKSQNHQDDEQDSMKAVILERGINQLIMEIQNNIFAEQRAEQNSFAYRTRDSAKAS